MRIGEGVGLRKIEFHTVSFYSIHSLSAESFDGDATTTTTTIIIIKTQRVELKLCSSGARWGGNGTPIEREKSYHAISRAREGFPLLIFHTSSECCEEKRDDGSGHGHKVYAREEIVRLRLDLQ